LLQGIVPTGQPLWIIPDGPLHYLPFECLLTTKPVAGIDQWPYALNRYPIAYAYSVAANFRTTEARTAQSSLALAPIFEAQQRGLATLKYATEESKVLLRIFPNGNLLAGAAASQQNFKEMIPMADIVHLSTHAHTDPLPQIEFFDGPFSLEQLYGLDIPAQLVVLSACETNIGTYEQGEGVMSLARSFFYAGAGSLLSSLWTVNESSTSLLMEKFYEQLGKGRSTAQALQQAKRDYLLDPAVPIARKSPYYWAGFIYIGPQLQLYRPSLFTLKNTLMGLELVLGAGSIIWWWRRK
ncbi:MAG: CHAT domain-containing protein, partial [Phaeodactylibacter sp.]|nr:CHAT domain-containing protein [Phaeodactylibacter sp.]